MTAGPSYGPAPHRTANQPTGVAPARDPLRPLEVFTGRCAVGLAIVAATATGLGLLLAVLRLQWQWWESVDGGAAAALHRAAASSPFAGTVLTPITDLGGNSLLWWLATVVAAAVLIRRRSRLAGYLVVAGLGALALTSVVKLLIGSSRPVVPGSATVQVGDGFPSGHALNATVFYGALLLVFLPVIPRRARGWVIGSVVALVVAVGLSRVALGVHHLSDVLAGWLLGVGWLAVTVYAYRRWQAEPGRGWRSLADGLEPAAAPALATPTGLRGAPWRPLALLPVAWVLICGALFGVGTLVIWWNPGFDEGIPRWLSDQRTPPLTEVSLFWSQLGGTRWIMIVALVVIPLAIAYVRHWRPAIFVALVMFGELGLFLAGAVSVGRARPLVSQLDGYLPTSSFPSGHVAATTCLYLALVILVVPRTRHWLRWVVVAAAVLMPAMVALSRMYRGEHHPLDVTAGILLALLWVTCVVLALRPNADLRADGSAPTPVTIPPGDPDAGTPWRDETPRRAARTA